MESNGMETSERRNQQDALGSHAHLVTEAQKDSLVTLAMVFIHVSSFPVCTDFLFLPFPLTLLPTPIPPPHLTPTYFSAI